MKKVGIIGGAGFIGSYITKVFLENGFEVKVSATDLSKTDKYKHLSQLPHANQLELVELNVANKDALKNFVEGCQVVYKAATTTGLHSKNYLLSSETYRVSDFSLMLSGEAPKQGPVIVYKNDLAKKDLNVQFKPVKQTLSN